MWRISNSFAGQNRGLKEMPWDVTPGSCLINRCDTKFNERKKK